MSEKAALFSPPGEKSGLETGLRANELRTLTRASLDLDGDAPTVTVKAAYSKHRRDDVLPLRPALAAALRDFTAGLAPAAQVFKLTPDRGNAAAMFRADVEAAGLPYSDADGRFADFHSLRHSFISNLASGGVHPKVAQTLARHSPITLTMDRYSHVLRGDQAAVLHALPDLTSAARQTARATGTDNDAPMAPNSDGKAAPRDAARTGGASGGASDDTGLLSHRAASAARRATAMPPMIQASNLSWRLLAQICTRDATSVDSAGRLKCADQKSKNPGNTAENAGYPGSSQRRGWDSNPREPCGSTGFQDRLL